MAKGKPNLAFLEALNRDKRRRGDPAPGGVFKTPEWFNKAAAASPQQRPTAGTSAGQGLFALTQPNSFRLTYTRIAAAAMLLLIVVMAGYIVFHKSEPPKLSAGIQPERSAVPQASVMDVPAGRSVVTAPPPIPAPGSATPPAVNPAPQESSANAAPAAGSRVVGMNYVVFQSYKDEKMADEAKDALVAGGIGATVEKGHPYAPTWFVVIGTQGFPPKANSASYLQYLNKCKVISEKFAGKSKWKQFEPNAYKWR